MKNQAQSVTDDEEHPVELHEPLNHTTDDSAIKPLTEFDPVHPDERIYVINAASSLMS